ncbi:MAG TPA: type II toxin-antitoxin system VapB family antitoxin [Caldilineae bacterium]|nr:type II toxin-antitoxin system VapB family antitoxin [Caldilineae bacterium]
MRTNIVLDRKLVEEAKVLTGIKTTRGVVDEALRSLVQLRQQAAVRQLRGKLHWEGDLDASRTGRFTQSESEVYGSH